MNFIKVFSCLLLLAIVDHCQARDKIFQGLREVEPNAYPWLGWILIGIRRVKCGAVLITPNMALTAASCITENIKSVTFGDHDRADTNGKEQEIGIALSIVHPDYHHATYEYDVAILMLERSANITQYVRTIPLLRDDKIAEKVLSKHCRVAGWGYRVKGTTDRVNDQSTVLYEITVDRVDNETCASAGGPILTGICYEPFRDPAALPCEGDSGGAYLCKRKGVWTLAGIMSDWLFGEGCVQGARAAIKIPAVIDWVNSFIP